MRFEGGLAVQRAIIRLLQLLLLLVHSLLLLLLREVSLGEVRLVLRVVHLLSLLMVCLCLLVHLALGMMRVRRLSLSLPTASKSARGAETVILSLGAARAIGMIRRGERGAAMRVRVRGDA